MNCYAHELRAGDRLQPDGSEVLRITEVATKTNLVEVVLRVNGRSTTYILDRYWPLRRQEGG